MDLTVESSDNPLPDAATSVSTASDDCNFTENDAVMTISNKKEAKQPKSTRRRKLLKNESSQPDNSSHVHTRSSKISENITSPEPSLQDVPVKLLEEEIKVADQSSDDDKILEKTPVSETSPDKEEPLPNTVVPGRENVVDGKQTVTSAESSVPALQPSVLQALGLSRGLGIGVGLANTINLSKSTILNPDQNRTAQTSVVSSATSTLPKTVPLLLNMPGGVGSATGCVPSLLPANLPPGRYVIISSTSASPSSPLATITTTTSCGQSASATPLAVAALQASSTTAASSSSLSVSSTAAPMPATVHKRSVTRLSPAGGGLKSSIRASVGKTRGMRKSYTNSEKLAMIEAVESGLRKSVVADKFGVAPSTLACIILQKEKIRRDQTKSSLSRRRIRPSSDSTLSTLPALQFHSGSGPQSYPMDAPDGGPHEGDYCKGDSGAADGGHGGHLSSRARSPPPFTHFLANFDQSMSFDAAQAEEIVSVPDLSQSLSFTTDGVGGCSPAPAICATGYCPSVVSSSVPPIRTTTQSCPQGDHHMAGDGEHPLREAAQDRRNDAADDNGEMEPRHTDPRGGCAVDELTNAGVPKPTNEEAANVEAAAGDHAAESQLSGLCLVKREVHCYSVLDQLLKDQAYTDVTITADGHTFYAHKVVLCVASGYFRRVLADQAPGVRSVVVFRDVRGHEMKNVLQFLYTGEATVDASDLASFMRTAQMLEIASLCDEKFQIPTTPPAAAALTPPAPSCDPLLNLSTLFSPTVSGNLSGLYPANGMPSPSTNPSPNLNTLFSSTNALPIVTNALRQQGLLTHQTMSQLQQLQTQKQQQQVVAEQLHHLREQLHATCSQMFLQSGEDSLKTSAESASSRKPNYSSEVQDLTYTKTSKPSFECHSSVPRSPSHEADDAPLEVCDDDRPACAEEIEVEALVVPCADPHVDQVNADQSSSTSPPPPHVQSSSTSPPPHVQCSSTSLPPSHVQCSSTSPSSHVQASSTSPPSSLRPLNLTSSSHCSELSPPVVICPSFHGGSEETKNISTNEAVTPESQPETFRSVSPEVSGGRQDFPSYVAEVDDRKQDLLMNESSPVHAVNVTNCSSLVSELKTQAVDLVVNWKTQDSIVKDSEIHNGDTYLKIRDHNILSSPADMRATNNSSDERSISDCSMENLPENSAEIIVESDECSSYAAGSRPSKKLKTFHRESE